MRLHEDCDEVSSAGINSLVQGIVVVCLWIYVKLPVLKDFESIKEVNRATGKKLFQLINKQYISVVILNYEVRFFI